MATNKRELARKHVTKPCGRWTVSQCICKLCHILTKKIVINKKASKVFAILKDTAIFGILDAFEKYLPQSREVDTGKFRVNVTHSDRAVPGGSRRTVGRRSQSP